MEEDIKQHENKQEEHTNDDDNKMNDKDYRRQADFEQETTKKYPEKARHSL